jgi:hypothetical protein
MLLFSPLEDKRELFLEGWGGGYIHSLLCFSFYDDKRPAHLIFPSEAGILCTTNFHSEKFYVLLTQYLCFVLHSEETPNFFPYNSQYIVVITDVASVY